MFAKISTTMLLSLSVVIGAMETMPLSELTGLMNNQTESVMIAYRILTKDQLTNWYYNNYRTLDQMVREADDSHDTCSRMNIELESKIDRLEKELRLNIVCPSNFVQISLGCVHISPQSSIVPHAHAYAYCSGMNSSLYSATSYAEFTELRTDLLAVSEFGETSQLWVDLIKNTSGDWIWKGTDFVQEDLSETYWERGSPYGKRNCGVIYVGSDYKLYSSYCGVNRYVMCVIRE